MKNNLTYTLLVSLFVSLACALSIYSNPAFGATTDDKTGSAANASLEEKVQAEIEKLLLIDKTSSATLKQTTEQQKMMMLKILSYAYASAERSLDLSGDAVIENEEIRKEIEKHSDVVTLVRQMAVLQMLSTRKMAEILHLQSRMLEVDSMTGLIKKERPEEDDKKDDKEKSDTDKSAQTAQ